MTAIRYTRAVCAALRGIRADSMLVHTTKRNGKFETTITDTTRLRNLRDLARKVDMQLNWQASISFNDGARVDPSITFRWLD